MTNQQRGEEINQLQRQIHYGRTQIGGLQMTIHRLQNRCRIYEEEKQGGIAKIKHLENNLNEGRQHYEALTNNYNKLTSEKEKNESELEALKQKTIDDQELNEAVQHSWDSELEKKNKEIKKLNKTINTLRRDCEDLNFNNKKLKKNVDNAEIEIEKLKKTKEELNKKWNSTLKKVKDLEKKEKKLIKTKSELEKKNKQFNRAMNQINGFEREVKN